MFIQAITECYIPLESVLRGDFKKVSVRPFVTLTKKAYSSFIIDSRNIICISGERAFHPLQENEAIFSKNIFFNCRRNFRKITFLLTTSVLCGSIFCVSGERD